MATLTLKNVPDALHTKLKEQARRHRRSMNNEAIVCLERALFPSQRRDPDLLIQEAEALNRKTSTSFSEELIEQGKRKGRA